MEILLCLPLIELLRSSFLSAAQQGGGLGRFLGVGFDLFAESVFKTLPANHTLQDGKKW
jgi:hypothetical protein